MIKNFIYFFEFILIKTLFFIFSIIGYKNSSNLGNLIGKKFGPLFRPISKIKNNLIEAKIDEKNNLGYYGECEFDFGGYFIINGSEKVLVCQERQAENKPYVFYNSKQNNKYSHIVEVKSTPSHKLIPSKSGILRSVIKRSKSS